MSALVVGMVVALGTPSGPALCGIPVGQLGPAPVQLDFVPGRNAAFDNKETSKFYEDWFLGVDVPIPPAAPASRTTVSCVDGNAVYIAHVVAGPGEPAMIGNVRRFDPASGESKWVTRLELPARREKPLCRSGCLTGLPGSTRPSDELELRLVCVACGQVKVAGSWEGDPVEWRFDADTGRPLGRTLPAFAEPARDGSPGPAYLLVRTAGFQTPPDTTAGLGLLYKDWDRLTPTARLPEERRRRLDTWLRDSRWLGGYRIPTLAYD